MTREQAELIIKEEGLIEAEWNKYGEAGGEYYFIIWFNPNNNKYETIYIGERGGVEDEYAFDYEREAIDKMLQMNYWQKKHMYGDIKGYLTKELALQVIKDENLEVIWYDEALKPLSAKAVRQGRENSDTICVRWNYNDQIPSQSKAGIKLSEAVSPS